MHKNSTFKLRPFCSLKQILALWVHCSNSAILAWGFVDLAKSKTAAQFYCDPVNLNFIKFYLMHFILVFVSISLFNYVRTEAMCFTRLLLNFTPHCFIKAKQGFHGESTHVLFSMFVDLDRHLSSLEFGSECTQDPILSLTYSIHVSASCHFKGPFPFTMFQWW